ncbi:MAG TPA: hypothetical protein VIX15_11180 [Streptosporangiaceae bacterium]
MNLTTSPLTLEHWPALEDLFGRSGASNGCWCMYWRIGPRYRERPCFYVRRTHRRRGVMGALIEAAVALAASAGAPAVEAYPVDTATPGHTGNLFPGTVAAFARHGFQVVARRKPDRPVMRRTLGSGSEPVGDAGQLRGG